MHVTTLKTKGDLEYTYFVATSNLIQFRVKAFNDARVVLTTGPKFTIPMYEIFIGGENNHHCGMSKNQCGNIVKINTPDIVSGREFRGFWIKWESGVIKLGNEGSDSPFLICDDYESSQITHFGLATGSLATGEWIINETVCWCEDSFGHVPFDAVRGGTDLESEPLYIGRAYHEGHLLPGKINCKHQVCYVSWKGKEHKKSNYQVLCGCKPVWVLAHNGYIPPNAISGGQTANGEPLYIGRANHNGTVTLGEVKASSNACLIPFNGKEFTYKDYEILVKA